MEVVSRFREENRGPLLSIVMKNENIACGWNEPSSSGKWVYCTYLLNLSQI